MIHKYKKYINEKYNDNKEKLNYYIFDWDDNILYMPTKIHMQKKIGNEWIDEDVTTKNFSIIRTDNKWRYKDNNPKIAFSDFGDNGERGVKQFLYDTKYSIKEKQFGPSWKMFLDCIINGNIFMIITARNHNSKTIKNTVEWIIYNILTEKEKNKMLKNILSFYSEFDKKVDFVIDQYLDSCEYFGVGDPINDDVKKFTFKSSDDIEYRKYTMIKFFTNKIEKYGEKLDKNIRVKYSQDDKNILYKIKKYLNEEKKLNFMKYKTTKTEYHVIDTSDSKKIKTKIF